MKVIMQPVLNYKTNIPVRRSGVKIIVAIIVIAIVSFPDLYAVGEKGEAESQVW